MSKLSRWWDWLLPGLICLSPMGAIAYYAGAEKETLHGESARDERRAQAFDTVRRRVVIPVARL